LKEKQYCFRDKRSAVDLIFSEADIKEEMGISQKTCLAFIDINTGNLESMNKTNVSKGLRDTKNIYERS
jgi:hypothetical protein